ncbi:nitrite reductase [Clostridium baratii]|uniref:Nitrite and sulphite reductase 4Fe-4S domain protein n=1 Tax=Clostridium baratii str. Sullivan TaxID=1415775 RepID=A0A0A7FWM3_9CLOT|nr:nitrite reductase [Clostridium baratii]AIY83988.1 nitrite and sulphite reductase 4Fe-4S domain protein [Clostridium baratii str. Sullivan]MDU1053029.1 nitrite reductase [Clostridium baratii]MDU4911706.1 nitrite reductase [Clostridium baratii]
MGLTNEEKIELKKFGILPQKQEGYYVVRFLSNVGYFSANDMITLSNIANKYGNGELSLTSRLTVEIPYIKEEYIQNVIDIIKKNNLRIGGSGKTVRAVLSCKGSVCRRSFVDIRSISDKIEKKFFGKPLPGKFKIGVFGCVNSYGKAQTNDLSIMPMKTLNSEEAEYLIFLGGSIGRKPRLGATMKSRFKEEELLDVIDAVLTFYKNNANEKERFPRVIERLGMEKVEEEILNILK